MPRTRRPRGILEEIPLSALADPEGTFISREEEEEEEVGYDDDEV